jgi:uncharacterized protein YjbJ (UPF0337 family)
MDEIQVKGNWNKIKGKAKEIYGSITDDKLKEYEGKYDQLVGYLQEKTGKAREEITSKLEDFQNEHGSEAIESKEEAHEREGKDIF